MLFHPRHWLSWCQVAAVYSVAKLPMGCKQALGKLLGLVLFHCAKERRMVTETNIRLCFPELNSREQHALVRQSLNENAIGLMETITAWFCSPKKLAHLADIQGLDIVEKLLAENKGLLIIGGHYTTVDMAGFLVSNHLPINVIYRRQKNPVIEWAMTQGRSRYYAALLERTDTRKMIRNLKNGEIVWYAADQDYGRKHSTFAPFFDVPAATITGASRIIQLSKCRVVFINFYRGDDNRYHITFYEPDNFPSGDDVKDATTINQSIELGIHNAPAQYMWLHRRFKTRPEGEAAIYPPKKRNKQRQRNREIYGEQNSAENKPKGDNPKENNNG